MNDRVVEILHQRWVVPTATAVVGFGAGLGVGYFATRRQHEQVKVEIEMFEADTAAFVEQVNEASKIIDEFTKKLVNENNEPPLDDVKLLAQSLHPSFQSKTQVTEGTGNLKYFALTEAYTSESELPEIELERPRGRVISSARRGDGTVTNIFENDVAGDEWDYKTELEARTSEAPYIIHVDEYVADEKGWDSQSTLTWYVADEILTDSQDVPIYNWREVVGELRFGHGSNDANVVYVRNEKLQTEYEVLRDPGSYELTVLGDSLERMNHIQDLKHSHSPRKFRDD